MSEKEEPSDSSPQVERWSRQQTFDLIFKKYWLARESENAPSEIIDVLETYITDAFNESDIWLTHPRLVKTAFSLLVDDLSVTDATVLYRGLTTILSHGFDQAIFREMSDKPFFDDESEDSATGDDAVINISELKQIADLINERGFADFSFENANVRISLTKGDPTGDEETLAKLKKNAAVAKMMPLPTAARIRTLAEGLSYVLNHQNLPPKLREVITDELNDLSGIDLCSPEMLEQRLTSYIQEQN